MAASFVLSTCGILAFEPELLFCGLFTRPVGRCLLRFLMDQFLQFLTADTPIFGFNFQNWILMAAAIVVIWTLILFRGAK